MLRSEKIYENIKNKPGRPKKFKIPQQNEAFSVKFMQNFLGESKDNN